MIEFGLFHLVNIKIRRRRKYIIEYYILRSIRRKFYSPLVFHCGETNVVTTSLGRKEKGGRLMISGQGFGLRMGERESFLF